MPAAAPRRKSVFLANAALMFVYLSWWGVFVIAVISLGKVGADVARYAVYLSWTVPLPSFVATFRATGGVFGFPYRLVVSGIMAATMMMASQFLLLTAISHMHRLLAGPV